MFCLRWKLILSLAIASVASVFSNVSNAEPIHGEIRRTVINPFGVESDLGWGLATDGTLLFASSIRNGTISILDPKSLATLDTISTPYAGISGLEFRDGTLFGSNYITGGNSQVFSIDLASRTFKYHFDAPGSITSLSFGPDGLLYASDGFTYNGTRLYGFDMMSDTLIRTTVSSYTVINEDLWYDINGTQLLQWMPDSSLLIDQDVGSSRLGFADASTSVLIPGAAFDVPGLPRRTWCGSTVSDDMLFLWGFRGGTGLQKEFYAIQIVPEPSSRDQLIGFPFWFCLVLVLRQRAVSRGN